MTLYSKDQYMNMVTFYNNMSNIFKFFNLKLFTTSIMHKHEQ